MRILEVTRSLDGSGVARVVQEIGDGLRAKGHDVSLVADDLDSIMGPADQAVTALHSLRLRPLVELGRLLRNESRQAGLLVIHVHHRRLALVVRMALLGRANAIVVEHVHSTFEGLRWLSFRGHVVICLSSGLARDLEQQYPHLRGRTRVVANGVRVPPTAPPRTWARPVVLGVGRVEAAKGVDEFGKICQTLLDEGLIAGAEWAGSGPDLDRCRREYPGVEWLGQRTDIRELMTRSHIFLSTSRREGLSLALLDAMAVGMVPACTLVGATSDVLDPSWQTGLDAHLQPAYWVDQLRDLLREPSRLLAISEEAHARVAENFSLDAAVRGVEAVISETVRDNAHA